MVDPTDSIDMQVLSEINSRTLVNGAALDPALISDALNISSTELTSSLGRLERRAWWWSTATTRRDSRRRATSMSQDVEIAHLGRPNG